MTLKYVGLRSVLGDDLPVDLSMDGWVARCQARRRWSDEILQEWSTDNGLILLAVGE